MKKEECQSGEVEGVSHWLMLCATWDHLSQPLLKALHEVGEVLRQ